MHRLILSRHLETLLRIVGPILQPLFEQGKYYIHKNHVEAREELLTIGSSRWDDLVDTLAYAEQILTPMFFEEKKSFWEDDEVKLVPNYGFG